MTSTFEQNSDTIVPSTDVDASTGNESPIPSPTQAADFDTRVRDVISQDKNVLGQKIREIRENPTVTPEAKKEKAFQARVDHWYNRVDAWVGTENQESEEISSEDEPRIVTAKDVLTKLSTLQEPTSEQAMLLLAVLGKKTPEGDLSSEDLAELIAEGKAQIQRLEAEITASVDELTEFFLSKLKSDKDPREILQKFAMLKITEETALSNDPQQMNEQLRELINENVDFHNVISLMLQKSGKTREVSPEVVSDSEAAASSESDDEEEENVIQSALRKTNGTFVFWGELEDLGLDAADFLGDDAWIDMIFATGRGGGYGRFRNERYRGFAEEANKEKEKKVLEVLKTVFSQEASSEALFKVFIPVADEQPVYSSEGFTQLETVFQTFQQETVFGNQNKDTKKRFARALEAAREQNPAITLLEMSEINFSETVISYIVGTYDNTRRKQERKQKRKTE